MLQFSSDVLNNLFRIESCAAGRLLNFVCETTEEVLVNMQVVDLHLERDRWFGGVERTVE